MKAFFVLLALLVFSAGASADMYPDASNAKLPDARANLAAAPHVPTNAALMAAATTAFPSGVWRDTFGNGNNAPPLWYTPSSSPCSFNSGDGDNGSQVKSGNGKCWLAVFPATGYDVAQFGANPAAVDNTAPINAAVAAACMISGLTAGNSTVIIGAVTYNVVGTIGPLNCNGVSLIGQSPFSAGITCTGASAADCIHLGSFPTNPASDCTGTAAPSTCPAPLGNRVSSLAIDAHTRTGYAIAINGAAEPRVENLVINAWKIFNITYVGHAYIKDVTAYMYSNNAADYGVNLYNLVTSGSINWYKINVIGFENTFINGAPGNRAANCMLMDGAVETAWLSRVGLLGCRNGLDIMNTQAQTVESLYPTFIYSRDLEIDGASNNAMNINAGHNMAFSQANFNNAYAPTSCTSCQVLRISGDNGHSNTANITFSDSDFHNSPDAAVYLQGNDITFNNVKMHDLCWVSVTACATAGGDSAIQAFGPSSGITVVNSTLGPQSTDFHSSKIVGGAYLQSGTANVIFGNNNYRGSGTGTVPTFNITNSTTQAVSIVGGIAWDGEAITFNTCAPGATC